MKKIHYREHGGAGDDSMYRVWLHGEFAGDQFEMWTKAQVEGVQKHIERLNQICRDLRIGDVVEMKDVTGDDDTGENDPTDDEVDEANNNDSGLGSTTD